MPVTLSVLEKIAVELKTRLDAMVSVTPPYQTVVSQVLRPIPATDHTPKHLQILIKQGTVERAPDLDYPGNPPAIARRVIFNLHLHVCDKSETSTYDTIANQFVADVIQAVSIPNSTWHTFDGNAVDAEFLDEEPIITEGGTGGVNLPLAIVYRTSEYNPYTVRA